MATDRIGIWQQPKPPKKRPSKFDRDVGPTVMPAAQTAPPPDKSVLVHDCFAQENGESKGDCSCDERISALDAGTLVAHKKADWLTYSKGGKNRVSSTSLVLRRAYVAERLMCKSIDPSKLLPAVVKSTSILSFKKGVIRAKNGSAFELEMAFVDGKSVPSRTDAPYWNGVLVALGLGAEAGKFLEDAAQGMGQAVSFTKLEGREVSEYVRVDGVDPEVGAAIAETLRQRKHEVQQTRHRVGAAGFRRGTGGLTYGKHGKVKKAPSISGPGEDAIRNENGEELSKPVPERKR